MSRSRRGACGRGVARALAWRGARTWHGGGRFVRLDTFGTWRRAAHHGKPKRSQRDEPSGEVGARTRHCAKRRGARPGDRRIPCRRRDPRAGADDGRAPCRPSGAGAASAAARRSRRGLDLRQPGAIRPARGFLELSAIPRRRHHGAAGRSGRPGVGAHARTDVSGGLRHHGAGQGAGCGRSRRPVQAAFLPRRGDGGRQAVRAMPSRRRLLRREGLPAAQDGHAHGPRPRPQGEGDRRRHRPRKGRPRLVVAQRLPVRRATRGGAHALSRAEGRGGADRGARADRARHDRGMGRDRSGRVCGRLFRGPRMPTRSSASRRSRTARCVCWRRRGSARRGSSTISRFERRPHSGFPAREQARGRLAA